MCAKDCMDASGSTNEWKAATVGSCSGFSLEEKDVSMNLYSE